MYKGIQIFFFFFCALSCLTGCGKTGLPGLVPGSGEVFYDGQPLPEATVTFHASRNDVSLRGAFGVTDENGKFSLMTLNPSDGIEPGEYIVTVTKMEKPPKVDNEALRKFMRGEGPAPPRQTRKQEHLIDKKYASQDTSGIQITIGSKGDKNIQIKLAE